MNEFTEVVNMIGTVGFPIVACFAMFKRMGKQDDKNAIVIRQLTEAVNNNTSAIDILISKM